MDELLNLLRTRLCNCSISKETIIKLKAYIESGKWIGENYESIF